MAYGISLDLGTSGFRSHLVDLDKDAKILDTAITARHPLPGANIMDHMHFWMSSGREITHKIIAQTIYDLISLYGKDKLSQVTTLSVCGNPSCQCKFVDSCPPDRFKGIIRKNIHDTV